MAQDLIYDVGMNNGDDTAYYLHRGFRVVAIEADPTLCAAATVRFQGELKRERLTILNIGIAAGSAASDFWICETNSNWNSFDRRIASRDGAPHHSIPVLCQSFAQVLEQYGVPYYLKIDIEGNDQLCIDALASTADLPQFVSVELGNIESYLGKFGRLGYTQFKCISQYNFLPLQYPPAPAVVRYERWHQLLAGRNLLARTIRKILGEDRIREKMLRCRQQGDWAFSGVASGPFGDATPGKWLDAKEMMETYSHYARLRKDRKPSPFWDEKSYSFWIDLHARRPVAAMRR